MTSHTSLSPPRCSALLALAAPAAAQQADRRRRRPTPATAEAAATAEAGRQGREAEKQADASSPGRRAGRITIQYFRAAGPARHQRLRDDEGRRASSSPASSSTSAPRSRRRSRTCRTATRAVPVIVQRRQRQPAAEHRLRLQQLDGEPVPERAARARHPRRADQLPVVAAPQRDVGEGRLHPDRRVADRLRAAQDADARSSPSASATWRSTTATRTSAAATTATRSTTRSSATTSWTRSRPRSAARSTSRPTSVIAMGADHRRRDPRHRADARPARPVVHRQARLRPAGERRTSASA